MVKDLLDWLLLTDDVFYQLRMVQYEVDNRLNTHRPHCDTDVIEPEIAKLPLRTNNGNTF